MRQKLTRKWLSWDTETYEEDIKTWGAGFHLGKGHLIGISFADDTGWSTYLPLAHPETTPQERAKNIAIAKEIYEEDCLHLAHNSLYDLVYMTNELGFKIPKKIHDTQYTEALLDEYRGRYGGPGYTLDAVSFDYTGNKKEKTAIEEYCEARGWKGDPRSHLWKMPASVVAPYARMDTELLMPICEKQMVRIHKEELDDIYSVESRLIPVLNKMNKTGMRVSSKRRQEVSELLHRRAGELKAQLHEELGECNYNSSAQLAKLLSKKGIEIPKTLKGNDSVNNEFVESLAHQGYSFAHKLVQWRKTTKVLDTFIDGAFVEFQGADGKIHGTLLPVAMDDSGTVSGRTAFVKPNLQQVPSKDGDTLQGDLPLGSLSRDIFIPEEGCFLGSSDLSQIELRCLVHLGVPPGKTQVRNRYSQLRMMGKSHEMAEKLAVEERDYVARVLGEIREEFRANPYLDYHEMVSGMTGLTRGDSKAITFGLAFSMGKAKMMKKYGWSDEKATGILDTYFEKLPFIKSTRERIIEVAVERGYIKTVGGRHAHLAPYMKTGPVRDRKLYRMNNRAPQGSAADIGKKAMVDADEKGLWEILSLGLFLHDELVMSVPKTREAVDAFEEVQHCMENAYQLNIPVMSESEFGSSWGSTKGRLKREDGSKETSKEFFDRLRSLC